LVKLVDITVDNFMEARRLKVKDHQRAFVDSASGILSRGYAYKDHRPQVFMIQKDQTPVGLCFVKDLDEEPACYDLQEFMIDGNHQGRGYGLQALKLVIDHLGLEKKYDRIDLCVSRQAQDAIGLYEKAGFKDNGYVDPDMPDFMNMTYTFE